MLEKKFKDLLMPKLATQTLVQLNDVKSFVDVALKNSVSQSFDTESEKIKYLVSVLYNIRDFVLTQTNENSVRISLIQQFSQLEEEMLGNESQELVSKSSEKIEENLEQDQ
jgi:hypothetical protein|tara:strand:+ start:5410 stop:5742 length:333 start_codon:yes stop_codon:yes gene_type:complete